MNKTDTKMKLFGNKMRQVDDERRTNRRMR